jgi:hypothetical protein
MRPLWRTSIGLREKQHHVAVEQRKGSLPYEVGTLPSAPVLPAIGSRTSSISRERPRWIRSIAARWCAESCAAPPLQACHAFPPGAAEAMPIDGGLADAPDGLIEDVQWSTQHWRHGDNRHGNNLE